nr:fibrobacter succinogenes major paralogous domain-containing protein [uncultured Marinifilum sp.]
MNRKLHYLIFGLIISLAGLVQSCDKSDDPTVPTVEVKDIIEIKETSAIFVFDVEDNGGAKILESGVCYGKNPNPTEKDYVEPDPSGRPGEYVDVYPDDILIFLEDLEDGVKYYTRAYAKNEVGIAYSDQKEFTTLASKLPKLSADLVSFDSRSATCKLNVTYDGGYDVLERGVVVGSSTSVDLDYFKFKEVSGKGKGELTITIKGLKWEEKYCLKAFASNENGTTYTEAFEFTTPEIYGSFTDERDGNVYRTVEIGSRTWMVDNLKYLPQVYPIEEGNPLKAYTYVRDYSGTDVNEAKETSSYKKGYVYYNLVAAQLSCPEGWHLPTDEEWIQLELEMGMDNEEAQSFGKRESLTHSDIEQGIYITGFDVFFYCGSRYQNIDGTGVLWPVGTEFWTNTELESGDYLYRSFSKNRDDKQLERRSIHKSVGICVRCVKDK